MKTENDNNGIYGIREKWEEVSRNVVLTAHKFGRNPDDITIVAVSKTHPYNVVLEGINCGIINFGENYVQELKDKQQKVSELSKMPINWHYIGHLQTNKVKYVVPIVSMIHSVDSIHLASEISKETIKERRNLDVLLQVNTSGELSKSGCSPEEAFALYEGVIKIENINVLGLMTIGSFSDDEVQIRSEFTILRNLKNEINKRYSVQLKHLSMGMTHDYPIAIEEGATILRIGTAIFGERDYSRL